jgi:hypothetical protein
MRRVDWLAQLLARISASQETPFEYGSHDCCMFAAKCVDSMMDSKLTEHLSLAYQNKLSATRFLASFESLEDAVTAHLGAPLQKTALASRGDVVMFQDGDSFAIGVCLGADFVAAGVVGVVYHTMHRAMRAWRVT